MAKALRTAALVVGAVALVATGVGAFAAAGTALAATAATVATVANVAAAGLSVGAALTAKAPATTSGGSQTAFSADPQAGVPYAIGRTGTKGNIVFRRAADGWSLKDTPNDLCDLVTIFTGAGPIDGYESFTSDKTTVTFDGAGNAIGEYRDKMFQRRQLGACPEGAALTVQAGSSARPSGWSTQHKLSGMAAAIWRLRYDTKQRFFQNGVPTPMWVARWVKVYDPRKDSTYPGGAGAHRPGIETTYEWSENPYLHALTWCIGRFQNGKRVIGLGAPVDQIIVSDFVEGANIADANAWTIGGVVYSRPDTKWNVLKQMLQAGAGEPLRVGARIGCMVNAPRVSLATIGPADIIGDAKLTAMQPIRSRLNIVTPRYRSEPDAWEIVPAAPIIVAEHIAEDGGERSREIEYTLVQNVKQAATLARYDIENTREFGPVTLPLKPKWLNYKAGDCITIDLPEASNQKMLIVKRTIDPATAIVTFEMRSETDGKHPFALGQVGTPPPTASVVPYDPSVPAPLADDWTIAAPPPASGIVTPTIVATGAVSNGNADAVIFEYRVYAADALPEAGWTGASLEAPTTVRRDFTGLLPGTAYEVGIRYRAKGVIGDRRVLGPITTAVVSVKGDPGAGSWTHIANSATTIVTPTSARGTASTGWGADGSQSKESYARGAAVDFVLPPAAGRNVMAGLTTHPTSSLSYDRISFAIFRNEVGDMDIRVDGNGYSAVSAPPADQPVACRVEFDGVDTVRWYVAGTLRTTMAWPYPDIPLFFACALASNDPRVESIAFSSIGARGLNGRNAISALLTNEAHTVPADVAGNVTSYTGANTIMRVYDGGVDVTDIGLFALSIVSNPQVLSISVDGRSFGVYGGFDASEDTAAIVARVTGSGQYAGVIIDKTFSLAKSKAPQNGVSPPLVSISATSQVAPYDASGTFVGPGITFTAVPQNPPPEGVAWRIDRVSDNALLAAGYASSYANGSPEQFGGSDGNVLVMSAITVQAYIDAHGSFRVTAYLNNSSGVQDGITVIKVKDGARGADGKGALSAYLTNENFSYPVDANGSPNTVPGGVGDGRMRVFYGLTEVTAQCTFTTQLPYWLSMTVDAGGNYHAYDLGSDNGFAYVIASYQGQVIALTVTATKSRQGGPGISAKTLYITSSAQTLSVNAGDALEPAGQAITFTAVKQNTGAAVYWQIFDGYGGVHSVATHSTGGVDYGDSITLPGANMLAIINYPQSVGQGVYKTLRVVGTLTDGVVISDTISVVKVAAGANGTPGATPTTWDLQTYSVSVTATSAGVTNPGQLPKNVTVKVMKGTVDVTAAATITVSATAGISATYASSVVSINQIDADGKVTVNATSEGVALAAKTIDVSRSRDPAPPASSTSLSRTDYFDVSSASYGSADTGIISLQSNASGQLNYTYFDQYVISQPQTNPKRTCTLASRVMYRQTNTSAWSYTTEVVGSQAVQSGRVQDDGDEGPGQVGTTNTITGLAANTYYDVSVSTRKYSGTTGATGYGAMTLTIRQ